MGILDRLAAFLEAEASGQTAPGAVSAPAATTLPPPHPPRQAVKPPRKALKPRPRPSAPSQTPPRVTSIHRHFLRGH